jgi:ornithine decarboxylase
MPPKLKNYEAYWRKLRASLPRLAKKHGTPLFIVSKTLLLAQVERFRKLLPRVEPFYAVKANPNPDVIKWLVEAGFGFDVASMPEIDWALAAGASPDRLIFANTMKRDESIAHACSRGVSLMTFDAEHELHKIAAHAPGANVLVRTKVPNIGSVVELSLKFGCDPEDAAGLLRKARDLGLNPRGVSFHVGSQCTHGSNYLEAFELTKIILNDSAMRGVPLDIVDIGGGFPIRYFDADDDWFVHMAPAMNIELDRLFPRNIRIIAEPGRSIVGPSSLLVMSVIGKSIRDSKQWYYLNDGVYGCLSGLIFDHAKYQFRVLKQGEPLLTTLAGPTCDSLDIIATAEEMPELEAGDLIYAQSMGAYSIAHATHFNGIPPAKTILVP